MAGLVDAPTLVGSHVRLEPLARRHLADLAAPLGDEEVCRYLFWGPLSGAAELDAWFEAAQTDARNGLSIPFATVELATGRAVGSTRLLDLAPRDRRVEIGSTFVARAHWRSAVNTEAKLLLLRHCFEERGCLRVALKTDGRNLRSQAAIERLGARREGTLRAHLNVKGFQRDTVYFSILAEEWPAVRERLAARLATPRAGT
ncbi:MAG: N-acetyltransferase [Planctomycetota bacterium]|nr:MAG: N-acetyltransferase [Planctomycetota bacterium]